MSKPAEAYRASLANLREALSHCVEMYKEVDFVRQSLPSVPERSGVEELLKEFQKEFKGIMSEIPQEEKDNDAAENANEADGEEDSESDEYSSSEDESELEMLLSLAKKLNKKKKRKKMLRSSGKMKRRTSGGKMKNSMYFVRAYFTRSWALMISQMIHSHHRKTRFRSLTNCLCCIVVKEIKSFYLTSTLYNIVT